MKNVPFPLLLSIAFLSILPSRSFGQGPGMGMGGMGAGPPVDEMKQQLKLTDEQVTKIRAIHKERREASQAACLKAMNAREDLREAMQSSATTDQLKKKFEEEQKLKEACTRIHFDEILTVRDVLTPEQRKQFGEMHPGPGQGRFGGPGMGRRGRSGLDRPGRGRQPNNAD
ncbi:MAG: Spy/CpxP family protein refolding chaperone [Pseudomonadota bacterium]